MKTTMNFKRACAALAAVSLLCLSAASCSETEEFFPGPDTSQVAESSATVDVYTLSFGDAAPVQTKALIRSQTGKFMWSADDRIAVRYVDNAGLRKWIRSEPVTSSEQVSVSEPGYQRPAGETLRAIYPFEAAVNKTDPDFAALADQDWHENDNDFFAVRYRSEYDIVGKTDDFVETPMVAEALHGAVGLRFYHTGAMFRFNVYNVPEATSKIRVEFDKNVTGFFDFPAGTYGNETFHFESLIPRGNNGNTVDFVISHDGGGISEAIDGLTLNVPVPYGVTFSSFRITPLKADGTANVATGSNGGGPSDRSDDRIYQDQIRKAWSWDAHRAEGVDYSVCFGYHAPADPVIGATDATHVFSVGPGKQVYIARSNLGYFGESFPDSPWRLLEEPWNYYNVPHAANGQKSDFSNFPPHSSGYVPAGHENDLYSRYKPWGIPGRAEPWGADDLDATPLLSYDMAQDNNIFDGSGNPPYILNNTCQNIYFQIHPIKNRELWDWGLYNGRRGSNPNNPNASGLWTYDGQELEGEWRTLTFEEVVFLLGILPCKNNEELTPDNNNLTSFMPRTYDWAQSNSCQFIAPQFNYYSSKADASAVSGSNITTLPIFYYNYNTEKYEFYHFERVVYSDYNSYNEEYQYSYYLKTCDVPAEAYSVMLNSNRFNEEGQPLYTYVEILDRKTDRIDTYFVLLPDKGMWKDPYKNKVSADGKLKMLQYSEDSAQNLYTYEEWKFFMEPAGAIIITPESLLPISHHVRTYCGGLTGGSYRNPERNNMLNTTYGYSGGFCTDFDVLSGSSSVRLVRDANP